MFTHSIYAIQTAAIDPFDAAKALSGDNVKIFGWQPSAVHFMCHFFGPESVGGKGNVRLIVEEEVKNLVATVVNELGDLYAASPCRCCNSSLKFVLIVCFAV